MERTREQLIQEENKRMRWLRWQVDLTQALLYQDRHTGIQEARRVICDLRRQVLLAFPGKEEVFDLIILPRLDRVLRERWGKGFDETIQ